MQFRDLATQYQKLRIEIDTNIHEVITSSKFISGPMIKELESALAEYVGVRHCISCANGTDALEIVLRAWGVGPGDAVFVPSFTFMSTAEVVPIVGAFPIFVDIQESTFNMDACSLESAICSVIEKKELTPKVVIPVDLFGQPANYDKILAIADKYRLKVLEDGAQGFGGAIRGKKACSFGHAATTSFFPAKPLGCYGDGGAIFTDDDDLAVLLDSICVHGKGNEKYENIRIGRNSRLDSIQAGILLPKLKAFADYELNAVNQAAEKYSTRLAEKYRTPAVPEGFFSSWAQYTLLCDTTEQRNKIQSKLKEKAIPSMIYYPCGLHRQKAFAYCGYSEGSLPVTEAVCRKVLSLPMHPYLTDADIESVTNVLMNL